MGVVKGLAHARDKSNEFPNIADVAPLGEIIDFEGLESQFSLLHFPILYLLRVPSGGLCMRRALIDQDLVSKRPLDSQSILGIADEESDPKLLLKLRRRKNVKSGLVLIRPCLCQ